MIAVTRGATPALVRLVQRERAEGAKADRRYTPEQGDVWLAALAAVAAFEAQSAADVALKMRTALAWEDGLRDDGTGTSSALVAALADLDRLAAAKVMA
jgi:hypothetical protein